MKKIIVRGPALSRSGYGEQARFALRALRSQPDKFDIYCINTRWGNTGWIYEDDEERQWIDETLAKTHIYNQQNGQYDISLQVTIPNEWEKLAPVNIGYTAGIETTKIAPEWIEKSNMMDKIIVVSNHAKNGFTETEYHFKTNPETEEVRAMKNVTPVDVVHYPVRPVPVEKSKLDFDSGFNFLSIAQWSPRKNLASTVRWYAEEFKNDEDVGLILKVSMQNYSIIDFYNTERKVKQVLEKIPDRKCKVYILHGDMTDVELTALYNHPKVKCLATLAHGEGFGLPLFEAAYNELPVLAPSWSGHCDFLYAPKRDKKTKKNRIRPHFAAVKYDLKRVQEAAVWPGVLHQDSMWCFPQKLSYKSNLREVYKNYNFYKAQAKRLAKYINKNFTADKMYDNFIDAMDLENIEDSYEVVVL